MHNVRDSFVKIGHLVKKYVAWISAIAAIITLTGAAYSLRMILELSNDVEVLEARSWDLMRDNALMVMQCKELEFSVKSTSEKFNYLRREIDENHPR